MIPATPKRPAFKLPANGEIIQNGDSIYQLGSELGQGYFGKVYECVDQWGNDLVAKVLVPRSETYDQVKTKWTSELKNLVNLRHPNVTYAYDAFEHQTTFYLILERCAGDLNDLLAVPGFDGELWLPVIARDILQAVHFMHRANYVHKDLHPGNIFLGWARDRMSPDKDPVSSFKVGDLGISRLESDINVFGTILAQWMKPPEAIDPNQFGFVDRRVDVYHVGLLLLSLVLGYVPSFTLDEILQGAPRQLAEALPSVYGPAIAKALRRRVAQRTQTAALLWSDLVAAMPPESIPR